MVYNSRACFTRSLCHKSSNVIQTWVCHNSTTKHLSNTIWCTATAKCSESYVGIKIVFEIIKTHMWSKYHKILNSHHILQNYSLSPTMQMIRICQDHDFICIYNVSCSNLVLSIRLSMFAFKRSFIQWQCLSMCVYNYICTRRCESGVDAFISKWVGSLSHVAHHRYLLLWNSEVWKVIDWPEVFPNLNLTYMYITSMHLYIINTMNTYRLIICTRTEQWFAK